MLSGGEPPEEPLSRPLFDDDSDETADFPSKGGKYHNPLHDSALEVPEVPSKAQFKATKEARQVAFAISHDRVPKSADHLETNVEEPIEKAVHIAPESGKLAVKRAPKTRPKPVYPVPKPVEPVDTKGGADSVEADPLGAMMSDLAVKGSSTRKCCFFFFFFFFLFDSFWLVDDGLFDGDILTRITDSLNSRAADSEPIICNARHGHRPLQLQDCVCVCVHACACKDAVI